MKKIRIISIIFFISILLLIIPSNVKAITILENTEPNVSVELTSSKKV